MVQKASQTLLDSFSSADTITQSTLQPLRWFKPTFLQPAWPSEPLNVNSCCITYLWKMWQQLSSLEGHNTEKVQLPSPAEGGRGQFQAVTEPELTSGHVTSLRFWTACLCVSCTTLGKMESFNMTHAKRKLQHVWCVEKHVALLPFEQISHTALYISCHFCFLLDRKTVRGCWDEVWLAVAWWLKHC